MEKSSTVMARLSAVTRQRLSNRQTSSLSASWKKREERRMNSKTQTVQERIARLIDVAAGRIPADVVVRNIHLVNVFDGHIEDNIDIALSGNQIAGIGRYDGVTVVDGKGAYAAPSVIDSHMHIESTMVVPGEFAKVALACGTGAVIADPHEIANVAGARGIRFMLEATHNSPLDFYFMLPSCVPATHLETNGETLDADQLLELRHNPRVLGLAAVSYTHLRAHETRHDLVCRLLLEKKKNKKKK